MMNFPAAPVIGDIYSLYKWDGVKWTCQADPIPMGDDPSDTDPLMNGVVLPGLIYKYSRGDHVHPTDTSRAKTDNAALTGTTNIAAANITGNIALTGTFVGTAKGHIFGTASGNGSAPIKSEANIILYDAGGDNWAGIGSDGGGNIWWRTGLSGSPGPAIFTDQARNTTFLKPPIAVTPPAGTNNGQAATTNFVLSNPASGPYLPLTGGTLYGGIWYINGDMRTMRAGDNGQGVLFLNNTGDRYIHYTANDQFHFVSAHCYSAAGRLIGNGEVGWPIVNERLAYLADQSVGYTDAFTEPYGGGVTTGQDGYSSPTIYRFRQFQVQTSSWWAVGYA